MFTKQTCCDLAEYVTLRSASFDIQWPGKRSVEWFMCDTIGKPIALFFSLFSCNLLRTSYLAACRLPTADCRLLKCRLLNAECWMLTAVCFRNETKFCSILLLTGDTYGWIPLKLEKCLQWLGLLCMNQVVWKCLLIFMVYREMYKRIHNIIWWLFFKSYWKYRVLYQPIYTPEILMICSNLWMWSNGSFK